MFYIELTHALRTCKTNLCTRAFATLINVAIISQNKEDNWVTPNEKAKIAEKYDCFTHQISFKNENSECL